MNKELILNKVHIDFRSEENFNDAYKLIVPKEKFFGTSKKKWADNEC